MYPPLFVKISWTLVAHTWDKLLIWNFNLKLKQYCSKAAQYGVQLKGETVFVLQNQGTFRPQSTTDSDISYCYVHSWLCQCCVHVCVMSPIHHCVLRFLTGCSASLTNGMLKLAWSFTHWMILIYKALLGLIHAYLCVFLQRIKINLWSNDSAFKLVLTFFSYTCYCTPAPYLVKQFAVLWLLLFLGVICGRVSPLLYLWMHLWPWHIANQTDTHELITLDYR